MSLRTVYAESELDRKAVVFTLLYRFLRRIDFSDHRNYWHFDIPAVMITDTAFYRNANYHRKTDTPDTLNYESMKKVVTGICWYLLNQE